MAEETSQLEREHEWLKNQVASVLQDFDKARPRGWWTQPSVLNLLTFLTLVVLCIYTAMTYRLQKVAQAELEIRTLPSGLFIGSSGVLMWGTKIKMERKILPFHS